MAIPTIKDVAKAAGVSIGTVSSVINNKKTVRDSTRQKVLKAIADLDYHPNIIARSLYKNQTKMIAFLVPDIANPGFSRVLKGIAGLARLHGYSVFVGETEGSTEVADDYIARLIEMRVDGLLLSLTWELARPELVEKLRRHHIEVIGVASARALPGLDCFLYDEVSGAYQAAKYLASLGHEHVAFVTVDKSGVGQQRLSGLKAALDEQDGGFDTELVSAADGYDETAAYRATLELIGRGKPLTCVVVFNDRMAVGVLRALREQGFQVPQDVSLLTFGDTFASCADPRLTTVVNPEKDLAREALLHLIGRIEGGALALTDPRVFKPQLVLRNSTCRLR